MMGYANDDIVEVNESLQFVDIDSATQVIRFDINSGTVSADHISEKISIDLESVFVTINQ